MDKRSLKIIYVLLMICLGGNTGMIAQVPAFYFFDPQPHERNLLEMPVKLLLYEGNAALNLYDSTHDLSIAKYNLNQVLSKISYQDEDTKGTISAYAAKFYTVSADESKTIEWYKKAIQHFKNSANKLWAGVCANNIIFLLKKQGANAETSIYYYKVVLECKEALANFKEPSSVYNAYYSIGSYWLINNNYDSAQFYLTKAIEWAHLYPQIHHEAHLSYSYLLTDAFDYINALKEVEVMMTEMEDYNDPKLKIWAYIAQANVCERISLLPKALDANRAALKIAQQIQDEHDILINEIQVTRLSYLISHQSATLDTLVNKYNNYKNKYPLNMDYAEVGDLLLQANRIPESIALYTEIIRRAEKQSDTYHLCESLTGMGEVWLQAGDFQKANMYAKKAYRLIENDHFHIFKNRAELLLSRTEAAIGHPQLAYQYLQKATLYSDSIAALRLRAMEKMTRITVQQKSTSDSLMITNQMITSELSHHHTRNILLSICLGLLLIGIILGFQYKSLLNTSVRMTNDVNQQIEQLYPSLMKTIPESSTPYMSNIISHIKELEHLNTQFSALEGNSRSDINTKLNLISQISTQNQALQSEIELILRQKEEDLRMFNYSIGHDLRGPLNNALNLINQFIANFFEQLDEQGKSHVDSIKETMQDIIQLINGVLLYSTSTALEIEYKMVNLDQLIQSVILQFKYTNDESRKVNFKVKASNFDIHTDPLILRLILSNLVANAVKFSLPLKRPEVAVHVYSQESGSVKIEIADNGVGIPEGYEVEQLFQIHSSAHNRTQFEGKGIGLAIVKRMTERLKGQVGISRRPEGGVLAYLELPGI
ncbi:tetratricopeptide repeat-containing sensor histidine kinase [Runella sp.]|uniref:sensor histidine kinase n=1 Tax=Runella sp. TaxID=1960881 RepID=UPI00301843C1